MTGKTSKKDALVPSWACHSVRPVFFHLTSRSNDPSVTLGVVKASLLANLLFKNFSNRSSLPSVTGSLNTIRQPLPLPKLFGGFGDCPHSRSLGEDREGAAAGAAGCAGRGRSAIEPRRGRGARRVGGGPRGPRSEGPGRRPHDAGGPGIPEAPPGPGAQLDAHRTARRPGREGRAKRVAPQVPVPSRRQAPSPPGPSKATARSQVALGLANISFTVWDSGARANE